MSAFFSFRYISLQCLIFMLIHRNSNGKLKDVKQTTGDCERKLYEECNVQREFTDEEMERVRLYLINRFNNDADLKPTRPPCAKLKLRRDFKCLTEEERQKFIEIIKRLYLEGGMTELGDIHARYWAIVHKSPEFLSWHRYITYKLEEKIAQIDPNVTVPYWSNVNDFYEPKNSLLFKYFGTYGEASDGYCVRNGMFADLNLTRCIRRQWYDMKLPSWESPEMVTSWIQRTSDYVSGVAIFAGIHFLPHLAVGGYAGDMSIETAAHDILFYLFHMYYSDVLAVKIQLRDNAMLTPLTYNLLQRIDAVTGAGVSANIATDVLTYWTNVTLAESFQLGFGELCSVTDRVVVAINKQLDNEVPVVPTAVQRMPSAVTTVFFPKFASGNYSWFDIEMDNIGDGCNQQCKPLPKFQSYADTPHGMRMMRSFDDNKSILFVPGLAFVQTYMYVLIDNLNGRLYCSPYIP